MMSSLLHRFFERLVFPSYKCVSYNAFSTSSAACNTENDEYTHFGFETVKRNDKSKRGNNFFC